MGSSWLKKIILRYVYRKKRVDSRRETAKECKILTVGVLGVSGMFSPGVIQQELALLLGVSVAAIEVVLFQEKKEKEHEKIEFLSCNDFGWNGRVVGVAAARFVKNDFDLLINYSKAPNLYLNVLTLLSNASFKTGFTQANESLFDLTVRVPNFDRAVFHEEIKKYLTILKKL